jgi:hypothetical protein
MKYFNNTWERDELVAWKPIFEAILLYETQAEGNKVNYKEFSCKLTKFVKLLDKNSSEYFKKHLFPTDQVQKNRLATYLKTDKNSGDKRTLTFTSSKLFSYQHLINGAAEPIPEKWSQSKINTTLRQKNVAQAIDTISAAMVGFIPEEFSYIYYDALVIKLMI